MADAILLPSLPASFVDFALRPFEPAVAFAEVVPIFSLVLTTVLPKVSALPMHLVLLPLAGVTASVGPGKSAFAMNIIVKELASVTAAIGPFKKLI